MKSTWAAAIIAVAWASMAGCCRTDTMTISSAALEKDSVRIDVTVTVHQYAGTSSGEVMIYFSTSQPSLDDSVTAHFSSLQLRDAQDSTRLYASITSSSFHVDNSWSVSVSNHASPNIAGIQDRIAQGLVVVVVKMNSPAFQFPPTPLPAAAPTTGPSGPLCT